MDEYVNPTPQLSVPEDYQRSDHVKQVMETIASRSSVGTYNSPVTRAFRGINHRQTPGALPMNKNLTGLTFFTRPMLNLTENNLIFDRRLAGLLGAHPNSKQTYIRMMLDYRLALSENLHSDLVDNQQAFIPLLTNTLESISGFRDLALDTYSSPEGVRKESWVMVDGTADIYSAYNLTPTFRNIITDPITDMFFYWETYSSLVMEGEIEPYPEYTLSNTIDYNTRIWRLILDPTKRYVVNIISTGPMIPISAPIGQDGNYERTSPFTRSNDTVSIDFSGSGMFTRDPILVQVFNDTVQLFNEQMKPGKRDATYRKVPMTLLELFNNWGYPNIDPETNELEWYIPIALFDRYVTAQDRAILEDEGLL